MESILLATSNQGKVREIQILLGNDFPFKILSLKDLNLDQVEPPEESGRDFYENSLIKARYYYELSHIPTVADDSGLCCIDLDGGPGIHSARLADTDPERRKTLVEKLRALRPEGEGYKAYFYCSLVFLAAGVEMEFRGKCEGLIRSEEKGTQGFGYDPIFYLPGGRSLAQYSSEEKNKVSHRGKAVRSLGKFLMEEWAKKTAI